ncbi:MAG: translation initiation factor IF-2 [Candidatus Omnitrophica bacterium]|nr:translation initiation factor IF-2 [Candidatus Omnitrophota bacterium]
MYIADLAKELKISEDVIFNKLKSLKLRAKEDGSITAGVEMIVRDALADDGIGQRVEDEEPKKKTTKAKSPKDATKSTTKKDETSSKKATTSAEKSTKAKKSDASAKEKATKKVVKKFVPALVKEEGAPSAVKPKDLSKTAAVVEEVKPTVVPVIEPEVKVQAASQPVKVEAPKVEIPAAPVAAKPVVDLSKIEIPKEIIAPVDLNKKSVKFDAPFETVKPLLKKRKGGRGDEAFGHGRSDVKPSQTISSAMASAVPAGPIQDIEITFPITVNGFAVRINQKSNVVLKKLLDMRVFANINQNLPEEIATKLATAFGFNLIVGKTQEETLVDVHKQQQEDPSLLKSRAPVVTFMGHVDHGKTSLLDRIRSAKVADAEHGGITQHIGSYSVEMPKGRITFLDTPGHEAFTAMRARGAHVTDIVVLVVAADDGIMPQTIEAINHARAANVPIVVALNKIDKKSADSDRVKKQLMQYDLAPEDWGGKTVVVGVSATTGQGVDELLELILLESELLELKANPDKKASGIVIEAHISKGRGPVATLLVQSGTLQEGDGVVVGPHFGRVKALFDDHKKQVKLAGPSTPVEILGLSEVPAAGEMFYAVQDEKAAREIAQTRQDKLKEERLSGTAKVSLEELYTAIQAGVKELRVIIKADVQGSVEAIKEALTKIPNTEVKVRIMHAAAGDVNASDVILAVASEAIIIAFNVAVDTKAKEELENTPVDVRKYRVIYDAVDDIRKALEGLLAPKLKRHFVGKVEIRNVFKLSRSGVVAGCYVQKGKIRSKSQIDILRNGETVYTGHISSLKRFKDDVKEVAENFECGITINGFANIQVGDIIEAFDIESIARKL